MRRKDGKQLAEQKEGEQKSDRKGVRQCRGERK